MTTPYTPIAIPTIDEVATWDRKPSADIETPEAMAERLYLAAVADEKSGPRAKPNAINFMAHAIRADREQIAAWCDGKAAEAKREAETWFRASKEDAMSRADAGARVLDREMALRHEGQASAFAAVAAMLRGAR